MKTKLLFCLLLVFLSYITTSLSSQTYNNIWYENFQCEADGATAAGPICGDDEPNPAPSGSWGLSNEIEVTDEVSSNHYVRTTSANVEGSFLTGFIDISSDDLSRFQISFTENLFASGSYIDVRYSVDGGPFTLIQNWKNKGSATHTLITNFSSEVVFIEGIVGNTLRLSVKMLCGGSIQKLILDNVIISGASNCNHPDYDNLMDLFNSTDGSSWSTNTGWGTDCDPCNWFGITCQNIGGEDRVTDINLSGNNLSGDIPGSLGTMSLLEELDLSNNTLTNTIPATLGNLNNLLILKLNDNSLIGCFDTLLANLCTVPTIDIDCNGACNGFGGTWANFCANPDSFTCCAPAGTPCDDGDPTTTDDEEDGMCNCAGTPCPVAGTACDDGDPTTTDDEEDGMCNCIGTPCPAAGTPCDDGDPNTTNDIEDGMCNCMGTPPSCSPNDDCLDAVALTVNANFCNGTNTNGNNSCAAPEGLPSGTCWAGSGGVENDVWYTIQIPANVGDLTFSTSFAGGTLSDSQIAIYKSSDNTCSGTFTQVACDEDSGGGGGAPNFSSIATIADLQAAGLTAGQTLFIQVDGFNGSSGTFCIEVTGTTCPTAGTPCDDGDPTTTDDEEDGMCNCSGIPCPAAGTSCDDGDPTTTNDVEDGMCNCAGTSGPILYLKLDNNLIDEVGNYDGSSPNALSYVAGIADSAVTIGVNTSDVILISEQAVDGLTDFTFAAYVKLNDFNNPGSYLVSGANSSQSNELLIGYEHAGGEGWSIYIAGTRYKFTQDAGIMNDLMWHHVVITRSGSVAKLYVDGQQIGASISVSSHQLDVDPGGFVIGQEQDCVGGCFVASESWNGTIDEFRLYGEAIPQAVIDSLLQCAPAGTPCDDGDPLTTNDQQDGMCNCIGIPDPVFYLQLNGNLLDSLGNYDGTASTTLTYVNGVCQEGVFIPKSTADFFNISHTAVDGLQDFSFSGYLKINDLTNLNGWVSVANSSEANELFLEYYPNEGWRILINGTTYIFNGADTELNDLRWHHIVITRKAGQAKLYIDGQLVGTPIVCDDKTIAATPNGFVIGQDQDCVGGCFNAMQSWNGIIDEFMLFDIALPQHGVDMLAKCPDAGTPCDDGDPNTTNDQYDGSCNCIGMSQPTLHMKMDGDLTDEFGNFDGSPGPTLTFSDGQCNEGVFIGVNTTDVISISEQAVDGLMDFTFAAYLKLNDLSNVRHHWVSCANVTSNNEFLIGYDPANDAVWNIYIKNTLYQITADQGILNDLMWHHFALSRKSGTLRLYIDGELIGSPVLADAAPLSVDQGGFVLGQDQDCVGGCFVANESWNGLIDEFKLFPQALLPSQIASLQTCDNCVNTSLDFDGTDDHVRIPHTPELAVGAGPITLEAWFKVTDAAQLGTIISKRQNTSPFNMLHLTINDGSDPRQNLSAGKKISFAFGTGLGAADFVAITTVDDVIDSDWHHIAAVVDPSSQSLSMYIDGVLQVVNTNTVGSSFPIITNTQPFTIGSAFDIFHLEGQVDDVRIWNTVRDGSQIQALKDTELTGQETGLVAYYKMDDTYDGMQLESCTGAHDGTMMGDMGNNNLPQYLCDVPDQDDVECQSNPGGVADSLQIWVKASDNGGVKDDGGAINTWKNHAGDDFDAVVGQPTFESDEAQLVNYNPVIGFDGSSHFTNTTSTFGLNGLEVQTFIVAGALTPGTGIFSPNSNVSNAFEFTANDGFARMKGYLGASNIQAAVSTDGQQMYAAWRDDTGLGHFSHTGKRTTHSTVTTPWTPSNLHLGAVHNFGIFKGTLPEVLLYNRALSDIETQKVESYLAMKYGFTLDHSAGGQLGDYLLSDESVAWDASVAPAYQNDIVALVRDNVSGLHQKQSHTQADDLRLYVGSLASDNAANSEQVSRNKASLIVGRDTGAYQAIPGNAVLNEMPAGIERRFVREWKITNANFVDDYTIEFVWDSAGVFDISDIRLLIDDDGDFSDAQVLADGDGIQITAGSITVSGLGVDEVPENSTRYITLGAVNGTATSLSDCVTELLVNQNTILTDFYPASDRVISTGIVPSTGNVIFNASNEVILNGGFEVKLGGVFEAKNEGCN